MTGIPKDAVRIAPGIYAHDGTMHIDAQELCEAHGVPCTEANLEALLRAAMKVTGEQGIELEVRQK